MATIATYHIMGGEGIEIVSINYGIYDSITWHYSNDTKLHTTRIYDSLYFKAGNYRVPLNECMRV